MGRVVEGCTRFAKGPRGPGSRPGRRRLIVFRYLTREILATMAAVAGVLLLVIMGSRFIRYFGDAAQGDIPASILGTLMLYHLPGFMELVLPLSFFLGILLAFGQLYLNSEITVLVACGISPNRLLRVTLWPALLVALLVALCSLWLTPNGARHNEMVLEEQKSRQRAQREAAATAQRERTAEREQRPHRRPEHVVCVMKTSVHHVSR